MKAKTVAIVEDEAIIALDLQSICQDIGFQVLGVAATATKALEKFSDTKPDILITDMELADGSEGVEVVKNLRKLHPDMAVIFITATTVPDKLERIAACNPNRVLEKPFGFAELHNALSEVTS